MSQAPSSFIRLGNRIVSALIRAGVPMRSMALLTVTGRRSGLPRTTPVTLNPQGEGWRLASPFGAVDWVRNLRASGEAEITRRGGTTRVDAREMSPEEAGPLLRQSMSDVGPFVRRVLGRYFEVSADASDAEWVEEARRHPTFLLTVAPDEASSRAGGRTSARSSEA